MRTPSRRHALGTVAAVVLAATALAGCGSSGSGSVNAAAGPIASSSGTVLSPLSAPCSKITGASPADQPAMVAGFATSMGFSDSQASDPGTAASVSAACQANPSSSVGSALKGALCTTKSTAVAPSTVVTDAPTDAVDPTGAVSSPRLRPMRGIEVHPARAGGGHGGGHSSSGGGGSSGGSSHSSGGGSSSSGSHSSGGGSSSGGSSSGGSSSGGSGSSGSSSSQSPCS